MRKVRLYVSSSPDLAVERETVGQVVAQLPLTLGWQIDHTPLPGERVTGTEMRVAVCDQYLLLLGHDFAAPMGAELTRGLRAGRRPLVYRKRCTPSPSVQDVVRRLEVPWRWFSSLDRLRSWIRQDLLQALLQRAQDLGLDIDELERLLRLAREETGALSGSTDTGTEQGGAGRSGIILGREVWEEER